MKEVKTKAEKKKFIRFQDELYKGVPEYVPMLLMDELANLDEKVNPAFDYCEARYWLCYDGEKIVGRVCGIINNAANEKWGQKRIRVCRIDFIDDLEVSKLLIKTVEDWGKSRGLTEIVGPLGFCDLDKQGMLTEGYDRQSMFVTIYNYPYYVDHFTKIGFEKDVDWVENLIYLNPDNAKHAKIERICNKVVEKTGVKVFTLKKKSDVAPYVEKILGLVNTEFASIYGTVPLPPRQMKYYANQFVPLINLKYLPLVEKDGELIGFGLLGPSLADAATKHKGRLFPFGFIDVLKTIAKPKRLEMYSVAVRSDFRNVGIPAVIMNEAVKNCIKNGVKSAETGPELETNANVRGLWDSYDREENFKRRRCWKKTI